MVWTSKEMASLGQAREEIRVLQSFVKLAESMTRKTYDKLFPDLDDDPLHTANRLLMLARDKVTQLEEDKLKEYNERKSAPTYERGV